MRLCTQVKSKHGLQGVPPSTHRACVTHILIKKHTNNTSLSNNLVYSILIKKHTSNTSLQQLTTYCTTWPSTHEACPRWRPLVHFGHRREILSCQLGRTVVLPVLIFSTLSCPVVIPVLLCFTPSYSDVPPVLLCSTLFHYVLLCLLILL